MEDYSFVITRHLSWLMINRQVGCVWSCRVETASLSRLLQGLNLGLAKLARLFILHRVHAELVAFDVHVCLLHVYLVKHTPWAQQGTMTEQIISLARRSLVRTVVLKHISWPVLLTVTFLTVFVTAWLDLAFQVIIVTLGIRSIIHSTRSRCVRILRHWVFLASFARVDIISTRGDLLTTWKFKAG